MRRFAKCLLTFAPICRTDGANTDSNGLLALLRRQVEKIVVFVNAPTPIETDMTKIKSRFQGMHRSIMAYFGYGTCILHSIRFYAHSMLC
jgi:hypothetical protein